jgi:GT2 family glycosyltransferase
LIQKKGRPIPRLSILIVNYNGLAHLEECLSSIYSQDHDDFEVVLVDNASRDGSIAFLEARFPQVKVVAAPANLGFAGGNNFGLAHCSGDHIFFLNNDTRLEQGALRRLFRGIEAHPTCRVFACLMLNHRDPSLVDNGGEAIYGIGFTYNFSGCPARNFTRTREVIGACGGAAVYARSLLDEIGAFDEDFFLLFEDVDLSQRARHHGEKILFLPDVRVLHKGSASIGGLASPVAVYFNTRNLPFVFVKNFPAITLLKALPGFALGSVFRLAHAVRDGRVVPLLRGLRDSVRLLPRMLRKRRRILRESKLSRSEFERLFRPGWLRERLAFKRGDFGAFP